MFRYSAIRQISIIVFLILLGGPPIAGGASVKIGIFDTKAFMKNSKAALAFRDIFLKELQAKRAVLTASRTKSVGHGRS